MTIRRTSGLFLLALGVTVAALAVLSRPAHAVSSLPLQVTKVAQTSLAAPGGSVGYVITIHNPNDTSVYAGWVTDTLPAGFSYQPSSTGGVTASDPDTIIGQTLAWFIDDTVNALSSSSLSFVANVSRQESPGTYCNEASAFETDAEAPTGPSFDSGPTAPVQVSGAALSEGVHSQVAAVTCQLPPPAIVRTATPTSTAAPRATATPVPPTAVPTSPSTPAPKSTVLAAAVSPRVQSAAALPSTGAGAGGGHAWRTWFFLVAGALLVTGAGLTAAGRKRA